MPPALIPASLKGPGVLSWVLYDLANTLFSFVILSVYFGPWLVHDLGAPDSAVTVPESLSMLLVALLAPLLGAASDRVGRKPFLIASTLLAVTGTAAIGAGVAFGLPVPAALAFAILAFALANTGFQLALVFYDALLPAVATPSALGRVGSLGVGIGYVGSFVGLLLGILILGRSPEGEPLLFLLTGLLFLAFAIPCFLFVPDPVTRGPEGTGRPPLAREAFRRVLDTVRRIPGSPTLARFLVVRWLYADAVNTVVLILGIYAVTEVGFRAESPDYALLLGIGIAAAAASAPLWGLLVDRLGPKQTLQIVLLLWALVLTVAAIHPALGLPRQAFYLLGLLIGVALAGTWTADRPLLVRLAPPDAVGEWFGLYALAGRFAAVTGPLLWSLTVDVLFPGARPLGLLVLVAMILAAFVVLRKLPDPVGGDHRPFAPFLPWSDGSGRPRRHGWRRLGAAPFLTAFLGASWILFVLLAHAGGTGWEVDKEAVAPVVYRIPDLLVVPLHAFATLVTAPFVNLDLVQLAYVSVLLLLFTLPFEAREGPRRTALLFFGTTAAGAITAGLLLHGLTFVFPENAFFQTQWERVWTGGSAGAFGLMGALAARARKPWPLLAFFLFWETNVGWWYLRSYTPAFHVTALLTGFLVTRFLLAPVKPQAGDRSAPAPRRPKPSTP